MENCCVAAVDMGTNSFHMIIARLKPDGSIKIIDREKAVIRLGSHKGEELSYISREETELAIDVLSKFKLLADSYTTEFRAVATSAVREAENKNEFIQKVNEATGIVVDVIDGKEEAGLIYLGAERALSLSDKNVLCIDIGGGSTEFINVNKNDVVFAESVKIGAVRLSKHFFRDYVLTEERILECMKYSESLLKKSLVKYFGYNFELTVGTSGTIEALAAMILMQKNERVPRLLNTVSFKKTDLETISAKILSAKTKEQRKRIPGMEEKRADIIPAGVIILNKIFHLFGLEEIIISGYALREGIILDMMKKHQSELNKTLL